MAPRAHTKVSVETDVLTASARRCCLCYGITQDYTEKPGQIAHVDGDRSNGEFANLAWLCLEHHDRYDGRTSQSKGITERELKAYRTQLYEEVTRIRKASSATATPNEFLNTPDATRASIRTLLAQMNPQIIESFDAGSLHLHVMISVPNVLALQQLASNTQFSDFLMIQPTGSTILGGIGNRIGNAINDLNEGGMLQGFMLSPTAALLGQPSA
jgi:hypothetical protein